MVKDEFIELPIDDEGHLANVRVSAVHTFADTVDPDISTIYTTGGNLMVPLPRHEVLALFDAWHEAQIRKVN